MECPVCYTPKAKYKLVCGHSFCYQCITHWCQECHSHTCPMCRKDIHFEHFGDTREIHVQCASSSKIDDYLKFQELLDKYVDFEIKDVQYLKRQKWVDWVMEYRAKEQKYTKYIFHGLQGAAETSHQKRQESTAMGILSKAYKD